MSAIIPTYAADNRHNRRQFLREASRIANLLEEVNTSFIWHVFNADPDVRYNEIYSYYLNQWIERVDYVLKTVKPKCCAIDPRYFERNYKPQI